MRLAQSQSKATALFNRFCASGFVRGRISWMNPSSSGQLEVNNVTDSRNFGMSFHLLYNVGHRRPRANVVNSSR